MLVEVRALRINAAAHGDKIVVLRVPQHICGSQSVMPDWIHELKLYIQDVVED